jgi:ubiquinone biosynthesis protein UbiJ
VQWRAYSMALLVTPAGLFDWRPKARARSALEVTDLPLSLAQGLRGDKPAIRIEGDVQLAAEINWLVDNVRWDVEEDLARLIGDAPAHRWPAGPPRSAGAAQFVGAAWAGARCQPDHAP